MAVNLASIDAKINTLQTSVNQNILQVQEVSNQLNLVIGRIEGLELSGQDCLVDISELRLEIRSTSVNILQTVLGLLGSVNQIEDWVQTLEPGWIDETDFFLGNPPSPE